MMRMKKMKRMIDADAAKEALTGWETEPTDEEIEYTIDHIPTVDAVPVVRCNDCKYWIGEEQTLNGEKLIRCAVDDERWTGGNDFCSFGTKFVHGHWVEDPENETVVCSNCGQEFDLRYKNDVCLNCYAKMDGKEEL